MKVLSINLTFFLISLTVSATAVVTMLVSAQGWEESLACLSALMAWKVATLLLISITDLSIPTLVSAMNCSQTAFSRRSTSFLESSKCSWKEKVELYLLDYYIIS